MANLIFDTMDLYYGTRLARASFKRELSTHFINLYYVSVLIAIVWRLRNLVIYSVYFLYCMHA